MGRAGQTFLAVMFNAMCFLRGTAELANDSSPHQGIVWKSRWFIVWKWQPGSVAMNGLCNTINHRHLQSTHFTLIKQQFLCTTFQYLLNWIL